MNTQSSTIRRISLSFLALLLVVSSTVPAYAQTTPAQTAQGQGQALEIGPPVVNLKGDPGATVKAQISLRDVSNNKLVVTNEINDFAANGENGTPRLLLDTTTPAPNSIIKWINPLPQFTLVPKQIQPLDLTIKIPANASPGGYYGVIRFTGTPPGLDSTGVALSASIGALVFIRVNGQAKEEMSIDRFATVGGNGKDNWLFESPPVVFNQTMKNSGNLFEKPIGQVVVTDMFGKTIGAINVNDEQGNVLPNSVRKFSESFGDNVYGNKFLFGQYTAKLTMQYGDNNQKLTSTLTYWIIPYRLIAAIIIGLIVLGLLIRFYLQRYRERILGNNRGGGGGRRR